MELLQTVEGQMKDAMRARDATRLGALRLLKAALVNKSVERGRDLDAPEALQVVTSLVKQRRESIEQFEKGNRHDLAEHERAEIAILETFLPPPVDEAEIERVVAAAIRETGATSAKDLGKVMKAVMAALAGTPVDGKHVNLVVRRALGGQ
jgi:hypothetical protein